MTLCVFEEISSVHIFFLWNEVNYNIECVNFANNCIYILGKQYLQGDTYPRLLPKELSAFTDINSQKRIINCTVTVWSPPLSYVDRLSLTSFEWRLEKPIRTISCKAKCQGNGFTCSYNTNLLTNYWQFIDGFQITLNTI